MKVVFFHKRVIQLGGAEIALINQLNVISKKNVNVILLTYFISQELRSKIHCRVKIISPPINTFSNFFFALKQIKELQINSILCGSGYIDLYFFRLAYTLMERQNGFHLHVRPTWLLGKRTVVYRHRHYNTFECER